jgi:hypothetical protein
MKKSLVLLAALVAACSTTPPQFLPPPFGPEGPSPTRLFFPTGLAKTNDGGLLVANGNFNHAFDAGTVVGISRFYLDTLFNLRIDCGVANLPKADSDQCNPQIPQDQFTGAVMIGNYAGPLVLDPAGTAAYTGSRDSGILNGVRVDPGGALHCLPGAGDDAAKDCRKGVINLQPFGVDGPYAIVAGDTVLPGSSTPQPALFVSTLIPHIEDISSGVIQSSSSVAVLNLQDPLQDPAQVLFRLRVAQPFDVSNGTAVGPMVFDSVRRQLYLSGCYQRAASFGAGEPGTGLCIGNTTNLLRILNVDSEDAASPVFIDLRSDVLSTFTTQLLLADPDPVTGAPSTLWATMRNPDSLVRIELPSQPSVAPRVRQAIPLPIAPADMARIDRGSASALLAVPAEDANAVAIVDTANGEVVAQVGRLGDDPFTIREISCPAANSDYTNSACLAVSVFGACRIALIEVPKNQPSGTVVRALLGTCP